MRPALISLALALALSSAPAAATDYIIELAFFAHPTAGEGAPWESGALIGADGRGRAVFGAAPGGDYRELAQGPALAPLVEKLAASGRYRLIGYRSWQQRGLPRGEAEPVRIQIGQALDCWDRGEAPLRSSAGLGLGERYSRYSRCGFEPGFGARRRSFELNGLATVGLGRYLHLDTELVYTDLRGRRSTLQINHRRMRSRRTHYIDNPAFGILAHITPLAPSADEPAPTASPDSEG